MGPARRLVADLPIRRVEPESGLERPTSAAASRGWSTSPGNWMMAWQPTAQHMRQRCSRSFPRRLHCRCHRRPPRRGGVHSVGKSTSGPSDEARGARQIGRGGIRDDPIVGGEVDPQNDQGIDHAVELGVIESPTPRPRATAEMWAPGTTAATSRPPSGEGGGREFRRSNTRPRESAATVGEHRTERGEPVRPPRDGAMLPNRRFDPPSATFPRRLFVSPPQGAAARRQ